MASKKNVVPEAREALNRFKMEAASEVGVNLKQGYNGDLTSKQAGSVGGYMVKKMIDEDTEMVSIYFGSESSEDDATVIAEAIEEKYPDVDVEINDGGQPIYYYVISVE